MLKTALGSRQGGGCRLFLWRLAAASPAWLKFALGGRQDGDAGCFHGRSGEPAEHKYGALRATRPRARSLVVVSPPDQAAWAAAEFTAPATELSNASAFFS